MSPRRPERLKTLGRSPWSDSYQTFPCTNTGRVHYASNHSRRGWLATREPHPHERGGSPKPPHPPFYIYMGSKPPFHLTPPSSRNSDFVLETLKVSLFVLKSTKISSFPSWFLEDFPLPWNPRRFPSLMDSAKLCSDFGRTSPFLKVLRKLCRFFGRNSPILQVLRELCQFFGRNFPILEVLRKHY